MRYADPPIPVLVDDNGGTWPGNVLGWRGDRVYVNYWSGVGLQHLTWVPAGRVRRTDATSALPSTAGDSSLTASTRPARGPSR